MSPLEDASSQVTRSERTQNPGAIKFGPAAASHGALRRDPQGFAVFPDYDSGMRAHADLLRNRYQGMTIPQMARHYSPQGHSEWARNVMRIGPRKPCQCPRHGRQKLQEQVQSQYPSNHP